MLFKRHVSDTCDVLQAEVHMVSIRHTMNLKRQIIENLYVPRRVKHLSNSLSRVYLVWYVMGWIYYPGFLGCQVYSNLSETPVHAGYIVMPASANHNTA